MKQSLRHVLGVSGSGVALLALVGALASAATVAAFDRVDVQVHRIIAVNSRVIRPGRKIPPQFSSYNQNVTPDLEWTPGPARRTRSYTVLVEDPDAPGSLPYVHWVVCNLPPDAHSLPGGKATGGLQPREAKAGRPNTAIDGDNGTDSPGWYGPHPPRGDAPHHYHFEVFALDRMLPVHPGVTRDAVVAAMAGHVVAKGELVATFEEL